MPTCERCGAWVEITVDANGENGYAERQLGGDLLLDHHYSPYETPAIKLVAPGTGTHVDHSRTCPSDRGPVR